ncbi:MAG: beta-lactamase family protein [Armatimonadetes bacterium]|nr:beta-lactamase family protein [Anaerolineae bacterium]
MPDARLQTLMSAQHIPGVALAIQQGDKLVYAGYHGFANLEHRVPVTADTVFEIASVTKLFTAQAVLQLVQTGRLTLDTRLADVLPDLPSAWHMVTVKHCLTHQSGIPNYTASTTYWDTMRHDKTHREVLALVDALPLNFTPGDRHAYDNTGFYLLGLLIERISGERYGAHLQRVIFAPLGMTQTQCNDYDVLLPHRAQGYVVEDGVLRNKAFYSISNTFSAGALVSTVPELLMWRASLFNDSILNADLRRLWWTPHPSPAGNERDWHFTLGLGWFILDSPLGQFVGHNGGIQGFASAFIHFPAADLTAIVLCNAGNINEPHTLAFEVISALKLL